MAPSDDIFIDNQRISLTVARSARRRRTIAFRMDSASVLTVTVPMRASLASIHSILQNHSGWIRRRLAEFQKAPAVPAQYGVRGCRDGSLIPYLGYACRLIVTHDKNVAQGCRLLPRRLLVNLHLEHDVKDLEEETRLEILLWLKKRAKEKLQKRTDLWAKRMGVRYRKLAVANAERRWGSCNGQNVIRLNWRLVMAPLAVLDYVAVHELAHVRHKNHGPRFWAQVASVVPDYKALRKQLHFIGKGLVL